MGAWVTWRRPDKFNKKGPYLNKVEDAEIVAKALRENKIKQCPIKAGDIIGITEGNRESWYLS